MKTYRVMIEKDTVEGCGIVRIDGKVTFVKSALAGEIGVIELTEEGKKYNRGVWKQLEKTSPNRVSPVCPYAQLCGGCPLSHVTREYEAIVKRLRVKECFEKIGGFSVEDALISKVVQGDAFAYRNKVEMSFREGCLGYSGEQHMFVPVEECRLLLDKTNEVLKYIKGTLPKDVNGVVIRTNQKGQSVLAVNYTCKQKILYTHEMRKKGITSLYTIYPKLHMTHALDGQLDKIGGNDRLDMKIAGITFHLLPQSFFQINQAIAEKMYLHAVDLAGLDRSEIAIDAYCGVGAIGMLAASKAKSVIGVEIVPEAVKDATLAAKENGIENISFIAGRCEVLLPIHPVLKKAGTIFLDPPRKGCDKKLLEAICKSQIQKIVYISCDPATLSRDICYLKDKGFSLVSVTPYDMFPRTSHIETVCLMSRKDK